MTHLFVFQAVSSPGPRFLGICQRKKSPSLAKEGLFKLQHGCLIRFQLADECKKACELTLTPELPEYWLHISESHHSYFKNITLAPFTVPSQKTIWTPVFLRLKLWTEIYTILEVSSHSITWSCPTRLLQEVGIADFFSGFHHAGGQTADRKTSFVEGVLIPLAGVSAALFPLPTGFQPVPVSDRHNLKVRCLWQLLLGHTVVKKKKKQVFNSLLEWLFMLNSY